MAAQQAAPSQLLDEDQLNRALDTVNGITARFLAGEDITDDERAKVVRFYSRIYLTIQHNGTAEDADVVRNNIVLMAIGGASIGDIGKYLFDCLTGNPVTAGDDLDDDPSLIDDLADDDPDDLDLASEPPVASASGRRTRRGSRGGAAGVDPRAGRRR